MFFDGNQTYDMAKMGEVTGYSKQWTDRGLPFGRDLNSALGGLYSRR